MDLITTQKQKAAIEAVKHIEDGFIVGLGSGSTAAFAIEALGNRIKTENLHIMGIPSSYQAFQIAINCAIPITTLEEHPQIDVTIDGADQLTCELFLIKGGGAALAREKIVAAASKLNVIIADQSKKVSRLGMNNQFVPLEVIPFALTPVKRKLAELGANPIIRETKGKLGPVITDNGNAVIDSYFGEIVNPAELSVVVKLIPGVVETGFFVGLTDIAYIGTDGGVEKICATKHL
ncbi:MAG: ribose-5-phosphate isomerase RpiA [Nitrososphaerota archaeon]|jgi:ribose 5-phosphate isomerase A|nr:ribose-5-phosphate isomerase RpiA [Nitrososphaerota archaeon]